MGERAFIRIGGDDRVVFLQGLLTNDVSKLAEEKIQFSALLSPQGKILHALFLLHQDEAILIDTDAANAPVLVKRLTMYKLRAKVTLAANQPSPNEPLPDPRHPDLPMRYGATAPDDAHLALGVPIFGVDILPDQMTAMDAGYDLLHGISFTKGCYVGQEVTARMHYKNIARKGFFLVHGGAAALHAGDAVTRGGKPIGQLTRAQGSLGLAFLKFEDAERSDTAPCVNNLPVTLAAPAWMAPKLVQFKLAAKNQ